jgi:hypothetical protein
MKLLTLNDLRRLYAPPQERAVKKQIPSLDPHCKAFIARSPFLILSTCDEGFNLDASPRGGDPGFVKITQSGELLIPDAPGNNRLDSFENILASKKVGPCTSERRAPKLVVRVTVIAAYLHCAKAFLRSKLWAESSKLARSALPTAGQMISDQTGIRVALES